MHQLVFSQPGECMLQHFCRFNVWRDDDSIVHPLALPSRRDDAGTAEVRQMTGNLRLWRSKNFDEVANANLLVAYEVEEAEPRVTWGFPAAIRLRRLISELGKSLLTWGQAVG